MRYIIIYETWIHHSHISNQSSKQQLGEPVQSDQRNNSIVKVMVFIEYHQREQRISIEYNVAL